MAIKPPKGCIDEADPRVARFGHPAPAWLFPYADLMTEMVCFFVILYALSASLDKGMAEAEQQIQKTIEEQGISGEANLTKEGLKIQLTEKSGPANFKSGFAELTPTMKKTLDALAPDLRKLAEGNRQILVQGHTDDVPIKNDYFWSNWELSTARATTVVEYLVTQRGLPPACLAAMGFGQFQPECGEKTAACRNKNRRVVLLVRNPGLSKFSCFGGPGKGESAPQAPPAPEQG